MAIYGKAAVSQSGTPWEPELLVVLNVPSVASGGVSTINVAVDAPGPCEIGVYTKSGLYLTRTATKTVSLVAGVNANVPVGLPVLAGQVVGFRAVGNPYHVADPTNPLLFNNNSPRPDETVPFLMRDQPYLTVQFNWTHGPAPIFDTSSLAGKKIAALGTSITAQNQYTVPLAAKLDCTIVNLGVGGGSLTDDLTGPLPHYGSGLIMDSVASIPLDADAVLVEVGINDFAAAEVNLGSVGDISLPVSPSASGTFHGALWKLIVELRTRIPDVPVAFLTPYSGGMATAHHRHLYVNGEGNTLRQFQQAIRDVAYIAGHPVIDVGGEGGIGINSAAKYTYDGLHLNALGGEKYAEYVAANLFMLVAAGWLK